MLPSVKDKFNSYPSHIRPQILKLRALIRSIADDNNIVDLEETLKWGEPAYLTKHGSTIRIDWKPKYPSNLFIYFNCKTTLVETFKEIYFDILNFEGKRAIVLNVNKATPKTELTECILMSLRYHKIKHLPLLDYQ